MSYGYDETYAVYSERTVKARKVHTCDACERRIQPRDLYKRVAICFDGGWETVIRCGSCQRTHKHLRDLCSLQDTMWPDERLNCGLEYADEWSKQPPPEIAALPLLSDAEAGRLLAEGA